MAVGGPPPAVEQCGRVGSHQLRAAQSLTCLGVPLDEDLSLRQLLDRVCARLRQGARQLATSLADRGFGLPMQAGQLPSRVEASALYGAELLASCAAGWATVVARCNAAYYDVAKLLLAGPASQLSLGPGGHVRAFLEARLLTRIGTKLTRRVITARARMGLLDEHSPVAPVLAATAAAACGATWWEAAEAVAGGIGIAAWPSVSPTATPADRKRVARAWARAVVDPLLEQREATWFAEQVAKLTDDGVVSLGHLLPLRQPWARELRWAPWSRAMWRLHRAWCVARLTLDIPCMVWGLAAPPAAVLAAGCPLCGGRAHGLHHLLVECPAVAGIREEVAARWPDMPDGLLAWALGQAQSQEELVDKVRLVGLAAGAYVHACVRAGG